MDSSFSLRRYHSSSAYMIVDRGVADDMLVLVPETTTAWRKINYLHTRELVSVTGRDVSEYTDSFRELPSDPTKQVIEVGAGIAEYVPSLVREFGAALRKPIVIDPLDYARLDAFLEAALQFEQVEPLHARIREMRDRIKIITDPNRVNLFSYSLLQAVERHSELHAAGDVVVDYNASDWYPVVEGYPINFENRKNPIAKEIMGEIDEARGKLLAPNGKLFLNPRDFKPIR